MFVAALLGAGVVGGVIGAAMMRATAARERPTEPDRITERTIGNLGAMASDAKRSIETLRSALDGQRTRLDRLTFELDASNWWCVAMAGGDFGTCYRHKSKCEGVHESATCVGRRIAYCHRDAIDFCVGSLHVCERSEGQPSSAGKLGRCTGVE